MITAAIHILRDIANRLMPTRSARARLLAHEHIRWAQARRMTPNDVLCSIGAPAGPLPSWDHALAAVTRAAKGISRADPR